MAHELHEPLERAHTHGAGVAVQFAPRPVVRSPAGAPACARELAVCELPSSRAAVLGIIAGSSGEQQARAREEAALYSRARIPPAR